MSKNQSPFRFSYVRKSFLKTFHVIIAKPAKYAKGFLILSRSAQYFQQISKSTLVLIYISFWLSEISQKLSQKFSKNRYFLLFLASIFVEFASFYSSAPASIKAYFFHPNLSGHIFPE